MARVYASPVRRFDRHNHQPSCRDALESDDTRLLLRYESLAHCLRLPSPLALHIAVAMGTSHTTNNNAPVPSSPCSRAFIPTKYHAFEEEVWPMGGPEPSDRPSPSGQRRPPGQKKAFPPDHAKGTRAETRQLSAVLDAMFDDVPSVMPAALHQAMNRPSRPGTGGGNRGGDGGGTGREGHDEDRGESGLGSFARRDRFRNGRSRWCYSDAIDRRSHHRSHHRHRIVPVPVPCGGCAWGSHLCRTSRPLDCEWRC